MIRIFLLLFILLAQPSFGQAKFERSTSEVLQGCNLKLKNFWSPERQSVVFRLIKETVGEQSTYFVRVIVESKEMVSEGRIQSFSFFNSNFMFSDSEIQKQKYEKGVMTLSTSDFLKLFDFLSETLTLTAENPENEKSWQMMIDQRLVVSLNFNPIGLSKWTYLIGLDGAVLEANLDESKSLLLQLRTMRDIIKKV